MYRYESDEDALQGLPHSGADPSVARARRASAGPSPSRFPTPDLPPVPRVTAEPARAAVPVPPPGMPVPEESPAPAAPPEPQPIGPEPAAPQAAAPQAVAPQTFAPQAAAPQSFAPPSAAAQTVDPERAAGAESATQPAAASAVVSPTVRVPRMGGRLWQVVVGGAAVLVLLAICGLGTAAVFMERDSASESQIPPPAQPDAARTEEPARTDLDSRDTDPLPLTAREVFPGQQLVVADGQPAYQVLKTHSSASCAVAATDDLADLLVRLGCNQVVRGTVRAPDGEHLATAGLLNLTDQATAERVRERIREILQERRGRFLALEAGDETEALTTAAARVAWQVRGHYIAYCLVVRADGQPVGANDPEAKQVLHDLIERHLDKGVLERRAEGDLVQPNPEGTRRTDPDTNDD
ncbi:hypothetical protein GA0070618_2874 [Micromonospora echinospora]|uniref:Uncharacterized protein n=1 Tax=Micromonospora echinospora TaxID=1877 RepID=A0A1C4X985_MICEC|nr:hypothetical protein GA0070618_2874 [Micromonospora echinospora]